MQNNCPSIHSALVNHNHAMVSHLTHIIANDHQVGVDEPLKCREQPQIHPFSFTNHQQNERLRSFTQHQIGRLNFYNVAPKVEYFLYYIFENRN